MRVYQEEKLFHLLKNAEDFQLKHGIQEVKIHHQE